MAPQEFTRRLTTVIARVDEIMQQEIRPLVAVDIIEQLHRQFAILSGGRGKDGAPIITFPEFVGFKHIPDEDFLNVMTYLTSVPSVEAASIGFVIVIDRRRDKWSSVKASLTRIAVAFPGNLQLIFILRPSCFIQRTFTDIGIKYYRDEFKMKVPIVMLNSVSDLHHYIDKSQLTEDLGGTLEYHHSQWINHRTAIENFALALKSTAQMLQTFGACLAATELPRSMSSSEDLLMSHTRQQGKLQDELKLLGKQGATLLSCIQEQATKSPTSKLSLNEAENVATMERLLVQLNETEKAFSQFWSEHHLKLNQCLQLQHFEHNFCEVKFALDNVLAEQAEFTDIGDSATRVEQLLKEYKKLEGKGQESLEKAQLLAVIGDQLIQSHHYAVDSIRPQCAELRHLCDDFINENKKKHDILEKSLELHRQLDKVSQWCEEGIYLLASQAVDKCQSREGVDIALTDIETFLGTAKEYQLPSPNEFYNQYELMLTLDVKAKAHKVLQKLGDVQEIFHKRQMSLMKLAARQTRPVQPVAPRPEFSPKWVSPKICQPSTLAPHQKTSVERYVETDLNSVEKEDETKFEVKNEEILESSHDGENPEPEQLDSSKNLSPSRRIIRDLLETEETYIKEIKNIIDGYIIPMDFIWLKHLIPDVLRNNKEFLFGNIRELYEFHNRTFLKELEKCTENPELLARCFLKRKEDLQMYFKYHKNLPRARAIWQECQDCTYFGVCQRQLGHSLPLFKYLRGPSQRLMKYQMLLKGLLDFESPEDLEMDPGDLEGGLAKNGPERTKDSAFSDDLQQALAMMEDLIKSCELAVDLAAVTGCPDDIRKLGKLLMHGSFNVWTVHKDRYKMKDLIRFKPSQRQIYLFEQGIVFCKIRMEPSDQGLSPHYSFKKSMKLMTLAIRQLGRGSNRKFEIANQNGLEKYILQAASKEIRDCWFSEISKLLLEQQNNIRGAGLLIFTMIAGCWLPRPPPRRRDVYEDEENGRQISPKCCSSREFISMETFDNCEGAEDTEKESSALSLSGLCQLDDSYESSKSVQETGESIQGEKEGGEEDTATYKTEESPGMSAGLLDPSGETGFRAEAVRAREGGLRPPSAEN
ncbi:probable guanine nucleotide exchange factor MCF2L2 isoform X1 [Delphinapterus leucas]|uniref:Probable guanine nucleotide exchange factor MCF2L2 isoform X1 n=1 Tax=Delphinapterus leucas TaxID=9749 RepID=A0A2Y9MYB0_DELLE|nr:probable guanine nucleotide exchange factor MCF2L2 isoform X1 [Delphinapterus leucas]